MQAGYSATAIRTGPVVVVGPCAALHKGGVAYFTSRLVEALAASSAVEFVTWHELYPRWLLAREVSLPADPSAQLDRSVHPILGFSNPRSWRRTADSIVAMGPTAIVLNWVHPVHAPIYAYLLRFFKQRCNAQRIVICHNVIPHERFVGDTLLVRFALHSASRLIVHSEQEAARASSLLPHIPTLRLEMPSFSMPERSKLRELGTDVRLLYFGAIRPYKGVDLLLEAMVKVSEQLPGCSLTIAGQPFGRYGELLKRQIAELRLDRVTLDLRYVPDAEIPELFSNATVVVLPFRDVTQSASLSLALDSELPVVTTDLPALRSCIAGSECVWTAAPNDVSSLVSAIVAAGHSTARRTRFQPAEESWNRYAEAVR